MVLTSGACSLMLAGSCSNRVFLNHFLRIYQKIKITTAVRTEALTATPAIKLTGVGGTGEVDSCVGTVVATVEAPMEVVEVAMVIVGTMGQVVCSLPEASVL